MIYLEKLSLFLVADCQGRFCLQHSIDLVAERRSS
jgi:hypothetical protein